jgi:acyl-CoA synthetase (AMP-forming)/AMP-acid ligase II
MNLAETFAGTAALQRDRIAIYWGPETLSYGSIEQQASWLADRLRREHQVRAGDRVAIWLKNCPEFVPALYAILKLGAVVAPINNFLTPGRRS